MPRSSGSASPYRHTAGPHRTREDLAVLRPELVARYDAELPGARAAVLARLLGAIDREPLPGLTGRRPGEASFAVARGAALPSPATSTTGREVATGGNAVCDAAGGDAVAQGEFGTGEDVVAEGKVGTGAGPAQTEPSVTEAPDGAGRAVGAVAGAVAAQLVAAVHATATVTVRYPVESARPFAVAPVGLAAEVTINAQANAGADEHDGIRASRGIAAVTTGVPTDLTADKHEDVRPNAGRAPTDLTADKHEHVRPDAGGVPTNITADKHEDVRANASGLPPDITADDHDGRTDAGGGNDLAAEMSRARLVADPAELVRLLWGDVPLVAEIDNSVANLALARADRPEQRLPEPGDADALGRIEQLVTDGHPLHPCCRTRGGMSVADVLAYAPEHSPVIRLQRLRVPRDRWYGTAAPILFAHPWQAARLVDRYPWLTPDGWSDPVRPLMSLRTVAPVDGGPHIKTAVDVQMTSAVRTVSAAAVHNGPVLSRLLRRLTADQPIEILAEIAAGAVVVDGVPQRHLAHVIREAPQLGPGELAVPLAVLAAVPVPVGDPYAWWERFADLFFGPVTRVLARGVALEAHGQNALVVLAGNQPTRILYRDLGGVRVSASRLRASGLEPPALLGDLPSDDPAELRTKLAASAFGTVAAELIAMFTRTLDADPDRLWGIVARAVRATGSEDAPHLLRDPLPVKATTAMRLATDPLDDRWALLPNPMAAHA